MNAASGTGQDTRWAKGESTRAFLQQTMWLDRPKKVFFALVEELVDALTASGVPDGETMTLVRLYLMGVDSHLANTGHRRGYLFVTSSQSQLAHLRRLGVRQVSNHIRSLASRGLIERRPAPGGQLVIALLPIRCLVAVLYSSDGVPRRLEELRPERYEAERVTACSASLCRQPELPQFAPVEVAPDGADGATTDVDDLGAARRCLAALLDGFRRLGRPAKLMEGPENLGPLTMLVVQHGEERVLQLIDFITRPVNWAIFRENHPRVRTDAPTPRFLMQWGGSVLEAMSDSGASDFDF